MLEIMNSTSLTRIFGWSLFWFAIALIWAIIEIELEGKYGWGEKAQTWYRTAKHHPKNIFLKYILAGKPLNGYSLPTFFLAFLLSHIPMLTTWHWSIQEEIFSIALFMTWAPLWDNLWIIYNPNYGIGKSGAKELWWYRDTFWFGDLFPMENVAQWGLSLLLIFVVSLKSGSFMPIMNQILIIGFLVMLSLLSLYTLRPLYEWYYWKMREHDDRDSAGIFHRD